MGLMLEQTLHQEGMTGHSWRAFIRHACVLTEIARNSTRLFMVRRVNL